MSKPLYIYQEQIDHLTVVCLGTWPLNGSEVTLFDKYLTVFAV